MSLGPRYAAAFHAEHERLYGHADRARALEVVHVSLRATAARVAPRVPRPVGEPGRSRQPTQVLTSRGWVSAALVRRDALRPSSTLRGPAVIEELSATTWVPPGWTARVDRDGNLVLRHAG